MRNVNNEATAECLCNFLTKESLSDRNKGLVLAVSSSIFIGASFIVKKKGLRAAGATGIRAGSTPGGAVVTVVMVKSH